MRCDAELCEFWTGMGCACAVFGIGPYAEEGDGEPVIVIEEDDDANALMEWSQGRRP